MASPEWLPPVIFRPARGQRGERLLAGIVCVACGAGILVFSGIRCRPADAARKGRHDNPQFTEQLATIRSYWQAGIRPR